MSPEVVRERTSLKEAEVLPLFQGAPTIEGQLPLACGLHITPGAPNVRRSKDNDRIIAELNDAYAQSPQVQDTLNRFRIDPEPRRFQHYGMDDMRAYVQMMEGYRMLAPPDEPHNPEERCKLIEVTRGLKTYQEIAQQGRNTPNIDEEKILMAAAAAREVLYMCNLRLAFNLAEKYFRSAKASFSEMDYVQEANRGLGVAITRYDIRHKERFSTYATNWIRNYLSRGFKEKSKVIAIPEHQYVNLSNVSAAAANLFTQHRREPTHTEVAAATGIDGEEVEVLMRAIAYNHSLDEPTRSMKGVQRGDLIGGSISPVGSSGHMNRLSDRVDAEKLIDIADLSRERLIIVALRRGVKTVKTERALSSVDASKLQDVVPGYATCLQVGRVVGLNRYQVSSIEKGVIEKLQELAAA